jgi:hypothetical protein
MAEREVTMIELEPVVPEEPFDWDQAVAVSMLIGWTLLVTSWTLWYLGGEPTALSLGLNVAACVGFAPLWVQRGAQAIARRADRSTVPPTTEET